MPDCAYDESRKNKPMFTDDERKKLRDEGFTAFDPHTILNYSERHKFVAKAAPLIVAACCIDTDISFSSEKICKNAVSIASTLYDEILRLREPDND